MTPANTSLSAREADSRPSDHFASMPIGLLSSIAHELRTPLSALSASAEMLETSSDVGEQKHFAAIIQRQAQRLNGIVEGLLEAHRASRGELRKVRSIIDMDVFLAELCEDQQRVFPHHRFESTVEHARQLSSDPRLLGIILTNLLSNAAKYSPAGSTVRLECRREGASTSIRVQDEGQGVPEFMRRRIFEAGERGLAEQQPGFGLGLFVAQWLCDVIGAEISVEDSCNGRGSCFVVTLQG